MKELTYLFIGCLSLLTLGCKQQEKTEIKETSALYTKFDEYFNALQSLEKFNGLVYVSQNGLEVIHKAYNLSNDSKHSLHVEQESQFDIHSVSKIMAQQLILKLAEEQKITHTDKVSKFIPDFPRGEEITIDMLVHHKSGLPRELSDFDGDLIDLEIEEMVSLIKKEPLIFEPGTAVQYSNLAYQLLYYIIGNLTQSTFEEQLDKALFIPLDMKNSGSHFYSKKKNIKHLAANHEFDNDSIVRVDNVLDDEFKQARIYSTTGDLSKLLDEFQNNPHSIELAKDSIISHSGGSDGIRAHIHADLKTKTNFILLTNYDAIPFSKTIKDVGNIIENKPYDIPKALNRKSIEVAVNTLDKYVGTYVFADMNNLPLLFKVKEKHLVVFQDKEQIAKLVAENDSVFFDDPTVAESFEFKLTEEGDYEVMMGFRGVKLKGVKK